MRKKKLVLILLVLSILFLLIGCVAWGNTNANLDKLNSLQFTDCAEGDKLSYRTESGIEINPQRQIGSVRIYPFCGKAKGYCDYAKTVRHYGRAYFSQPLLQTAYRARKHPFRGLGLLRRYSVRRVVSEQNFSRFGLLGDSHELQQFARRNARHAELVVLQDLYKQRRQTQTSTS